MQVSSLNIVQITSNTIHKLSAHSLRSSAVNLCHATWFVEVTHASTVASSSPHPNYTQRATTSSLMGTVWQ